MGGRFYEPVGDNFNYSGDAYDHALMVISCGMLALLLASYIRRKFFFSYPDENRKMGLDGLYLFYAKYRKSIWLSFIALFISIAATNLYFGIYQRGTIPRTHLPYGLSGVYTWLLLFGASSFSALLLEFEFRLNNKTTYSVVALSLLESFFSNVSMLSRGMILNIFALSIGMVQRLKTHSVLPSIRFKIISILMFIMLFGCSIIVVNQLRLYQLGNGQFMKEFSDGQFMKRITWDSVRNRTKILVLDRWVGIEGVMAVSSHPELGWSLWREAWKEKYSDYGTSFYDLKIASSGYSEMDFSKHHYISLPGILAFFYYPGSFGFLFLSMFLLGVLAAGIEVSIYRLSEESVIITALLAQVVAYRYAHFGYVPGQSYLLFGTICMNVLLVYALNKILLFWPKRFSLMGESKKFR